MFEWLIFSTVVISLLLVDLKFSSRYNAQPDVKHSLLYSSIYVAIAVLFGIWIYYDLGPQAAGEYYNIYLIEKLLALDNILIISVIFNHLNIPTALQQRVLTIGIVSVIVLRGIMISCGVLLVQKIEFIIYFFSIFLIFTGIKLLFSRNNSPDPSKNIVLKFLSNYLNITNDLYGQKFFVYLNGKIYITRLMVALLYIETMDIIFAIDSIPAAFSISYNIYIIFTANIFAVLGLRALYFALNQLLIKFEHLHYSLAIILIFIGSKAYLKHFIDISATCSLVITIILIFAGLVSSFRKTIWTKLLSK